MVLLSVGIHFYNDFILEEALCEGDVNWNTVTSSR